MLTETRRNRPGMATCQWKRNCHRPNHINALETTEAGGILVRLILKNCYVADEAALGGCPLLLSAHWLNVPLSKVPLLIDENRD